MDPSVTGLSFGQTFVPQGQLLVLDDTEKVGTRGYVCTRDGQKHFEAFAAPSLCSDVCRTRPLLYLKWLSDRVLSLPVSLRRRRPDSWTGGHSHVVVVVFVLWTNQSSGRLISKHPVEGVRYTTWCRWVSSNSIQSFVRAVTFGDVSWREFNAARWISRCLFTRGIHKHDMYMTIMMISH